jgi:outer membrane murein-binding lipoprotein Lpp
MRVKLLFAIALLAGCAAAQTIALNEFEVRKGRDLTATVNNVATQVSRLNLAIDAERDAKNKAALTDRRDKLSQQLSQADSAASKWCLDVIRSRKQNSTTQTCDWTAGKIVPK